MLDIPKKYFKMAKEVWQDEDGFWATLKDGYVYQGENSVIATDTKRELIRVLRWSVKNNQKIFNEIKR